MRRARADAQRYASQLEDQAMELELQTAELEQQMQEVAGAERKSWLRRTRR